jgi:hypothetical protein
VRLGICLGRKIPVINGKDLNPAIYRKCEEYFNRLCELTSTTIKKARKKTKLVSVL